MIVAGTIGGCAGIIVPATIALTVPTQRPAERPAHSTDVLATVPAGSMVTESGVGPRLG